MHPWLASARVTLTVSLACMGCHGLPSAGGFLFRQTPAPMASPPTTPTTADSTSAQTAATGRATTSPTRPLEAGDLVYWSVGSQHRLPDGLMGGKNVVNNQGQVVLGHYGSVSVAGLTMEQARTVIEAHLASVANDAQLHVLISEIVPGVPPPDPTVVASTVRPLPPPEPVASSVIAVSTHEAARNNVSSRTPIASDDFEHGIAWQRGGKSGDATPPGEIILARADEPPSAKSEQPRLTPQAVEPKPAEPKANAGKVNDAKVNDAEAGPTQELTMPQKAVAPPFEQPIADGIPGNGPPRELDKVTLPPYVIEPPDVLLIESTKSAPDQPITGQHLVRPDGSIGLGIYGSVYVAGMTLDQAKVAIEAFLSRRIKSPEVSVDVLAYNSKVYYVITDGGGYGETVTRFPVTGNETVLDAIGLINGLPPVASKRHIWVARRTPGTTGPIQVLPVDWCAITQQGLTGTNYQLMPGDRIYVKADRWRTFDAVVAKVLSPFERMIGVTLLGSSTVNSIRGRNTSGNGIGGVP
jgi:polysaccharide export outer membrane protein